MRKLVIAWVATAVVAGRAHADPVDHPEPYPLEILAVDAASMAAAAAVAMTAARDDFDGPPGRLETFAATWWLASTVTTPGVHFAHRRRAGWLSLGLRLTVPVLSSGAGALVSCIATSEDGANVADCEDDGFTAGMIAGTAAAAAIDAWWLTDRLPGEPPPPGGSWYGWNVLAVDAAAASLAVALAARPPDPGEQERSTTIEVAAGAYVFGFLGAPWVHVARGRPLRGLGSFALRLLVPPVAAGGAVIGWCAGTAGSGSGKCAKTGAEIGLLGGAVLAATIDAFALSWSDEPAPRKTGSVPSWTPGLTLEPGGARLTLAARF